MLLRLVVRSACAAVHHVHEVCHCIQPEELKAAFYGCQSSDPNMLEYLGVCSVCFPVQFAPNSAVALLAGFVAAPQRIGLCPAIILF